MKPKHPRQRIVVTRGERYDVADWAPGEPEWFGAGVDPYVPSRAPEIAAFAAALVALVATGLLLRTHERTLARPLVATVADVSAVHAGVSVGGRRVDHLLRASAGDSIETDPTGRARVRLDDGTSLVVDRTARLQLGPGEVTLEAGRAFLLGAPGARTTVKLGAATLLATGSDLALERAGDQAKVYVASGEVTLARGDAHKDETVAHTGETATIAADRVSVAPERGFDDWTFGMAAPWGAHGPPRRAVGELWGRTPAPAGAAAGDVGSPLTLRSHDVRATVTRELAETETETTFFNGGSAVVAGDFRMAIPPGAIVSRFAVRRGESVTEAHVALASRRDVASVAGTEVLEWAGDGWLRGTIPNIAPGQAVTVIVGYAEWLAPRARPDANTLVVQYRYPMAGEGAPPLVGEFSAHVDAGPSNAISMAAGLGARVEGQAVEVRRPDFRPTADLVVDVEIAAWKKPGGDPAASAAPIARLYVADPVDDDDSGASVLVRTEAPLATRLSDGDGVALALVMDVSESIEPGLFDAERALVDAILAGLGPRDRAVVLAADQTTRPVGPPGIGSVDADRRRAVSEALSKLSPGGATDLGRALEAGSDALPADAPAAMVVYIGDGWPTVGDPKVGLIAARLARRPHGAPRIGAVAVGPLANRAALAALVRGGGPLFEIADSTDAARVAVSLLSDALVPTVASVELELGPEVERVYPRGPGAIVAGDTLAVVGRVRGELPHRVVLRWRDATGDHRETREVLSEKAANPSDVRRRWASARVDDIALLGAGREAATDVALRAGLLTPWTGWITSGGSTYVGSRLDTRILDLAASSEGGFTAAFATPSSAAGTLVGAAPVDDDAPEEKEDALKASVIDAARRAIEGASTAVRACRESRAALRPELAGSLDVDLKIDGDGRASTVRVRGGGGSSDDALDRCIELVIEALVFPESGLKVQIEVHHRIVLPPARASRHAHRCSPTSTLPMPLRRGVWRERLDRAPPAAVYLDAKAACELPTWSDRRALLELVLLQVPGGVPRIDVARELADAGEVDAAALLRREAVRRAESPDEMRAVERALVGDERYPVGIFRKRYSALGDDGARLALVRRFLALAPHDARLRRRLLALLEALGKKEELLEEIARVRRDPFSDARLLADGASALARLGDADESRRAFGELTERAPNDPWARAFLGDVLRNEGRFEEATQAYAALAELVPDDPAASVRLALAHAGAGRLDIALRSLARVAQTGGRAADSRYAELATWLAFAQIADAKISPTISADDAARLERTSLELPQPTAGATLFLVRAPAESAALEVSLVRGSREARDERAAELAAVPIGLYGARVEAVQGDLVLRLKRRAALPPASVFRVRVTALVAPARGEPPTAVTTDVTIPNDGKPLDIVWTGGRWGGP